MKAKNYFDSMIKFYFLLFIGVMLFDQNLTAQEDVDNENRKFDSIYFETAVHISAIDINRAISISDSLYKHATTEIHKLKALMLTSQLHNQKGEIKKSIDYAKTADKIAVENDFYDWEARISGFLSTQFRTVGLFEQGEVYLQKGKIISRKVDNQQKRLLYLGMIFQETAYYEIEYQKFKSAYESTKKAQSYFNQLTNEENRTYFQATNENLYGEICTELGHWKEAIIHFERSKRMLAEGTNEDALLMGSIYAGLGRVYLETKKYELAIENLKNAERIVNQSEHLSLKEEVYKALADYYKSQEEYDQFSFYSDEYLKVLKLSEKKKKESIESFVNTIKLSQKKDHLNIRVLFIISVGLLVIIIIAVLLFRRSRKRSFKRFTLILEKAKNNPQNERLPKLQESKEATSNHKKPIVSPQIEEKILIGLDQFEKTDRYRDKQISLPTLAGILNTNTKYLSYVLNSNKKKDFNSYINELRISYIIDKFQNCEEFKNYKISYLADECGFSSHSKFSAVFKSITGLSPSIFLEYLHKSK